MKRVRILLICAVLLATICIVSCQGPAGNKGKALVSLDWLSGCILYGNFSEFASGTVKKQYYEHKAGVFYASYYLYNPYIPSYSSLWNLTYTITVNDGGPGQMFWQKGPDGADSYFRIYCGFYTGPSVYGPSSTAYAAQSHDDTIENSREKVYEEIIEGDYKIILEAYKTNIPSSEIKGRKYYRYE